MKLAAAIVSTWLLGWLGLLLLGCLVLLSMTNEGLDVPFDEGWE